MTVTGLHSSSLVQLCLAALGKVPRCNRSTARNDEIVSALDFLKWHLATFQEAADVMCVAVNRKGISLVASFLPLSGHSGHGRNCCSLEPVAVDPEQTTDALFRAQVPTGAIRGLARALASQAAT